MKSKPSESCLERLRNTGITSLLAVTSVLGLVVLVHVAGLWPVPGENTLVHRLMFNPVVAWGLLAVVILGSVVLAACPPERLQAHVVFLAGLLGGLGLASAVYFDGWLAVILFAVAGDLYRKSAVGFAQGRKARV